LFGAPVAHEDDAERAVRAGLGIRDALAELNAADPGLRLQVRVGIATGEALVRLGARPHEGEGMAAGDVVNTAARLQAAAPVNGVLVGEGTYRATTRAFEYREAEPVEAKGKAEHVLVWEALEARSRFGVDVVQRDRAPLVGREDELELLAGALGRVRRERAPQLVTLVGVPGIGKSRLVWELFSAVDAEPELVYWRQGRCLPYGDGVAFWALAEMLKAHAGVFETDAGDEAEAKLRRSVRDLVRDPGEAHWVEGHLRPLLGLGGEAKLGADRRPEVFTAWRRFFEALAEQRPLVLVFEDLHWADDGLLDFVDHLVDWAGDVPILVVGTARPELLERRPEWGGGKRNATTVSLSPLSERETARLLSSLLERVVLPAELQTLLLARAGGNPLYAEEFARMLSDRGLSEDVPLPESVQGVIAARLDLLRPEEKALLQDAAVVGKVFWSGALSSVEELTGWTVEERLHALERKEFVRRERRSQVSGETEYAFRHVLVRDVAYGQIPRGRRADKHRAVAEWIGQLAPDRAEDHAEMLAHHYLGALEFARAAGQPTEALAEPARLALRAAGDRSAALNAFPAAERFYRAAIEIWPPDDVERPDLLLRLGRTFYRRGPGGEDVLEEAAERLLESGDPESAAEAMALLADGLLDGVRASALLQKAVGLVAGRPPSAAKATVLIQQTISSNGRRASRRGHRGRSGGSCDCRGARARRNPSRSPEPDRLLLRHDGRSRRAGRPRAQHRDCG
ncbi:MAG: ATP-binding protein, partial [Gaiellaceae bacterium]